MPAVQRQPGGSTVPRQSGDRSRRAFSLVELLVSVAIVGVLLSLLIPLLGQARVVSRSTLCMANLRQIGTGWTAYLDDHEVFPSLGPDPDWNYGGADFVRDQPVLSARKPINPYIASDLAGSGSIGTLEQSSRTRFGELFRCPADAGVYQRGDAARISVLQGETCFRQFGTSYRANPFLLDASRLPPNAKSHDDTRRPLRRNELAVSPSRLLILADAAWFYATRPEGDPQGRLDASWHNDPDAGNMLSADGAVRWAEFDRRPRKFAVFHDPALEAKFMADPPQGP